MDLKERSRPVRSAIIGLIALAVVAQACTAASPIASPTAGPEESPSSSAQATAGPTAAAGPKATAGPTATAPALIPVRGATLVPGTKYSVWCEQPPEGVSPPEPHSVECWASIGRAGDDVVPWSASFRGPCSDWATAPDSTLFVACDTTDGFEVLAIDGSGLPLPGWPVAFAGAPAMLGWNDLEEGCGWGVPPIAGSVDGTVYVATNDGGRVELRAVNRDGRPRAGWPQSFPGEQPDFACAGFVVAADGSIRTWGHEGLTAVDGIGYSPFAERSVFSALRPDGTTLAGWPVGSTGTASGPVIGADGTLYYVSATSKVWGHDSRGLVKPGWPFQLADGVSPRLTSDGRLLFLFADSALALTDAGAVAPGWPYDLPGPRQSRCFPQPAGFDTDCFGDVVPALADDGTFYVSLGAAGPGRGGSVVALDASGSVVPGWPYELPDGAYASGISTVASLYVVLNLTICSADGCRPADDNLLLTTEAEPVY